MSYNELRFFDAIPAWALVQVEVGLQVVYLTFHSIFESKPADF